MTRTSTSAGEPTSLPNLTTRYLERQVDAQVQGFGYAVAAGEVEPHEAIPVRPVDPQTAWHDAQTVLTHFSLPSTPTMTVPPDWPLLVTAQESAGALALCLGNFPQLVRDLHPLLTGDLAALRHFPDQPLATAALREWAVNSHDYPHMLLAAGILRLARHYVEASELLRRVADGPAEWQPVRANEEAALAWHRGLAEEALTLWQTQAASVPVLFNRGMASLFLGHPDAARTALNQVVAILPDTSAWYHLGQLYLALARR